MTASTGQAKSAILGLLAQRDHGKTICPSEAARELDPDGYRELMPLVRRAAAELAAERRIEVTQRGEPVDPASARGPIRLRSTGAGPPRRG